MAEDEFRYLYERLGPSEFQQLVSALLAHKYPGFQAFPIGQADGGRDGIISEPDSLIVYQVKWSKRGQEKDPVTWLKDAIEGEALNIRALAKAGARRYIIVTNLEGTSMRGRGHMDKLDAELRRLETAYHMPSIECVWRPTLNAWVSGAPTEITWAFADMLAGWDLIRYIVGEFNGEGNDTRTRRLIRKIAEVAWSEDEKLKFSQLAIGKHRVASLFVDVGARQLSAPPPPASRAPARTQDGRAPLRPSVSQHLLNESQPYTLILGAPGQGKSTLTQYICQSHRAAFVNNRVQKTRLLELTDEQVRFPIRIELGTYAAWFEGEDVFEGEAPKGRRKSTKSGSIEAFLAEVFSRATGDRTIDVATVDNLLDLVPALVVFDGLDEVGNSAARERVVAEIERFTSVGGTYGTPPRVIVTSRPNASDLPEPSAEVFEVLSLEPFTDAQIATYMRQWCAANDIKAKEGRQVRRAFMARAKEAYIGELASNPMQLTILLDLLNRDGEAAPTQRTDLYDSYVDLLLVREANRYPKSVKNHQADLKDIVPFLGWYIQSRSEEHNLSGRMSKAEVRGAMVHFQETYSKPTKIVDELLDAVSDRLWALTSKEQGTFEFDIQSLREYFAAQFLYRFAGEEDRGFDRTDVLRELLRRPFWFNTARFYGGNADTTDLYVIASGIEDAMRTGSTPQTAIASWTLLTDGVFNGRPRQADQALDAVLIDRNMRTLLSAHRNLQIVALPGLPTDLNVSPVWRRLSIAMETDPRDTMNTRRVDALHQLLGLQRQFSTWWIDKLSQFIGTQNEHTWIRLGTRHHSGAGYCDDDLISQIDLDGPGTSLVLESAFAPSPGGQLEALLVARVLDGQAQTVTTTNSHPARVAVALAPRDFITRSSVGFTTSEDAEARRRNDAIRGLARDKSPFASVAKHRVVRKGEKNSTFPWANTATALFSEVGHCWLSSEIAIIGAAHPHNTGAPVVGGSRAFGVKHHPATLLRDIRDHANDLEWWNTELDEAENDLSRAEWALAVWAVGSSLVLDEVLSRWEAVLAALPRNRAWALSEAVELLNGSGLLRDRPITTAAENRSTHLLVKARSQNRQAGGHVSAGPGEPFAPLAETARDNNWLLVDRAARAKYR